MSNCAKVLTTIRNRLGLHARPAMAFVDTASRFQCKVTVRRTDVPSEPVDGKSIMQMMMLAAIKGAELEIVAEGADAEDACTALRNLVERGFDEN